MRISVSFRLFLLTVGLPWVDVATAESIVFPADAGVVDVKAEYGAKGDGVTDDTAAIQKAFNDYPARNKIIYLPDGTYLISRQITWPPNRETGWTMKNTILQGQSQAGTILRLKDNSPDFQDPAKPKHVVWTGGPPAQRFRNSIRNLTINTGAGNPGAIGLSFCASNQGSARELTIIAGDDGKQPGFAGLDLTAGEVGPCFVKNVTVIGFDRGVRARGAINSITLENIQIAGQRVVGVDNAQQILPIRNLTSVNAVTALKSIDQGVVAIVGGSLTGRGAAAGLPALVNEGASTVMFVRDVKISGYGMSITNSPVNGPGVASGDIDEWVSHPPITAFPSTAKSLHLPIKETPQAPWDDLRDWANVDRFRQPGEADDTAAIQRAIDSGKPTVYFPNRGQKGIPGSHWAGDKLDAPYLITDTIHIRGKARRLIGCEAKFQWKGPVPEDRTSKPMFRFEDGDEPIVWFERFTFGFEKRPVPVEHAASRTFVMSAVSDVSYINSGNGDLFLEDVGGGVFTFSHGQHVWARQFNPEVYLKPRFVNDGAVCWLFGVKSEPGGPQGLTKNGGQTEVTGAFQYTSHEKQQATGFYITEDSVATYAAATEYVWTPKWGVDDPVKETRNGETRSLPKTAVIPRCNGSALPLYSARPASDLGPRPSKPSITVKETASRSVALIIGAPAGVAGVKLWRDNVPHRTVHAGEFCDADLDVGREYVYRAVAFTFAGAESEPGEVRAKTTPDTTPPTTPSHLRTYRLFDRRVDLHWDGSKDDVAVTGYELARTPGKTVATKGGSFTDLDVTKGRAYCYHVVALDAAGNRSAPAELTVNVPATPPGTNAITAWLTNDRYDWPVMQESSGACLGNTHHHSWALYRAESTGGEKPFNMITFRYGAPDYGEGTKLIVIADAKITTDGKVRRLEGGRVLATHIVHQTGGWSKLKEFSSPLVATDSGPHDLFILFDKGPSSAGGAYVNLFNITLCNGDPSQFGETGASRESPRQTKSAREHGI